MRYFGCSLAKRNLKKYFLTTKKAFERAESIIKSGRTGVAADWLCDNFYVILGEYRRLSEEMRDWDDLPERDGYPRIYPAVLLQVREQKLVSKQLILSYLSELSEKEKACACEIYSYRALFTAAVFQILGSCCERMLSEADDTDFSMSGEYSRELEYCISALRFMGNVDVSQLADKVCEAEKILSLDPAGCYSTVKPSCRDEYRKRLARLAKKNKISETELARRIIEKCEKGNTVKERHVGYYLFPKKSPIGGICYFGFIIAFSLLFTLLLYPFAGFFCLLCYPAAYELGKRISDFFGSKLCMPTPLLSLELSAIPEAMKTLCVTTVLLSSADSEPFDRLEEFYLSNKEKNSGFGLLADLPESGSPTDVADSDITEYAKGRIEALNIKYGGRFFIVTRRRSYSQSEKKYMGWERKRGAVIELVRLLCGKEDGGVSFFGDERLLKNVKYLVTLDADTLVSCGDVKRMVEYMAHPNNLPEVDEKRGVVTDGYGIMQPRMDTTLFSAEKTVFSHILGGNGGSELYTFAAYDSYQELFGEGIFCGKGILDVEVFSKVIDGAFPENIVLSHDILEGSRLRTALICDTVLYDSVPSTPLSYFKRAHRWIRGDVQALFFALPLVKNAEGKRIKNPINLLSRYKIIDNVRRDLLPLFSTAAVVIAAFLPTVKSVTLVTAGLSYIILPFIFSALSLLFSKRIFLLTRRFYANAAIGIKRSLEKVFFDLCALFYEAQNGLNAAFLSLYRVLFSHEKTLEWQTASAADKSASGLGIWIKKALPGSICAAAVAVFGTSFPPKIIAALWIAFPIIAHLMGTKISARSERLERRDADRLRMWAHDMWGFYARYVNAQSSYLPPDNVSESPKKAVAMRTSPTNIGFYLISVLCARDMGFINTATLYSCICNTLNTVEELPKWKGHLYNWYDLRTKRILGRAYVSTVDSGNFCSILPALYEGLLEYAGEEPRIVELCQRIKKLCYGADFSALYDKERNLFFLGYDDTLSVYDKTCYDLFMSEARLTSYFAVATGQIPARHWYSLSRRLVRSKFHIGLASWTGTAFEYFMPALFLPTYKNSLAYEAQTHCLMMQKTKKGRGMWGTSESGFYAFDGDMNYQYKAFGVGALALKTDVDEELVLSPYSSFLCADAGKKTAIANLVKMKDGGFYGKFGFYEAVDLTEQRVGSGVGKVQSYMAHHVGMSICACANMLFSDRLKNRFMRNPAMSAAKALLCEKIPADAQVFYSRYKSFTPERRKYSFLSDEVTLTDSTHRHTAVISNCKMGILCDSKASILVYNGSKHINCTEFGAVDMPKTMRVFFTGAHGTKDFFMHPDQSFEYGSSFARYSFCDGCDKATLTLTVAPDSDSFLVSLSVESDAAPKYAILCFEPMLEATEAYLSHPAYSGLFIESEYDAYNEILVISRKNRGRDSGSEYIAVSAALSDCAGYCTRKDAIFKNGFSQDAYLEAVDSDPVSKEGVCVIPYCLMRSKLRMSLPGKYEASFVICASDSKQEAMANAADLREKLAAQGAAPIITKLSALCSNTYAISGTTTLDVPIYRRLLNAVAVPEKNKKSGAVPLLWQLGISGDHPIVVVRYGALSQAKIASLIRLHRLLLLKWIRTNLVIIYENSDGYTCKEENELRELLRRLGSTSLIGTGAGIFLVDESKASKESIDAVYASAVMDADSPPPSDSFVPYPEVIRKGSEIADPQESQALLNVRGGYFTKEGFTLKKNSSHLPWCHVIASRCFGTVLSENSFGSTYLFNSQMGLISAKDPDLMREAGSERLILTTENGSYDLAACAKTVRYGFGDARYEGSVDGIPYTVTVTVGERDFVKSYELSFGDGAVGKTLTFAVTAYLHRLCEKLCDGDLCEFSLPGGFLNGYTSFARLMGGEFSDAGGALAASLVLSKNTARAYLGAYRGDRHKKRIMDITESGDLVPFIFKLPENKVSTGQVSLDLMANGWLPYQNLVCRIYARSGYYQSSGAYGFRDQLQDAANAADYAPDVLKRHLIRCACHQFVKGDVLHWWHRTLNGTFGIRTRCSDDRLWLVYALCVYVEATGDKSILDIKVPYIEGEALGEDENEKSMYVGKTGPADDLYSHLVRALMISTTLGRNSLPLIGSCDWNDSFCAVGEAGQGESVWLAWFMKYLCDMFIPYAVERGDSATAQKLTEYCALVTASARKNAYEYGQYLRGFYADGTPLGTKLAPECKTDVLPQAFAVLSHGERGERLEAVLDSIESLYDPQNGIFHLFSPPFSHEGEKYTGYVRDYPCGIRENGGQYTHGAMWAVLALHEGGRTKIAKKILSDLCPAEKCTDPVAAKRYGIEPYVAAGDVYAAPSLEGRGGWSWYTGAAGWMRKAIMEIFEKRS